MKSSIYQVPALGTWWGPGEVNVPSVLPRAGLQGDPRAGVSCTAGLCRPKLRPKAPWTVLSIGPLHKVSSLTGMWSCPLTAPNQAQGDAAG